MSRFVDRLMQWATGRLEGGRRRLPPAPPIVLGHLRRLHAGQAREQSADAQRERFIRDAIG